MTPGKLYQIRIELGLTQAQLAERIGVSREAVNKWENGKWPITTRTAKQIAGMQGG